MSYSLTNLVIYYKELSMNNLSDEKIKKSAGYFLPCVRRFYDDEPICFVDAKGGILKDQKGKEYIDLLSSHGCTALIGHNRPEVIEAIKKQLEEIYFLPSEFPTPASIELAEKLIEMTPAPFNQVYFANSGAEAVEVGLFLSKRYQKKFEIISLYGGFHGRSHGARSILGHSKLKKDMGPFLNGCVRAPSYYCYRCHLGLEYPSCNLQCAKMLDDIIKYDTSGQPAAFVAETMQATAGYIPAPEGYFKEVKKILDKYEILLFLDEIFTAFGNSGEYFRFQAEGVTPDLFTMSKTLGGGIPISALVTSDKVGNVFSPPEAPQYFTTYGSNPVSAAAALASLKIIEKEKPWEKAKELGQYWMEGLAILKEKYEIIGDIRGRGILIGVELVKNRKTKEQAVEESIKLKKEAFKRGLILPAAMGWDCNVIRLSPSVVIGKDLIDKSLSIIEESLKAILK